MTPQNRWHRWLRVVLVFSIFVTSCGGGGGEEETPPAATSAALATSPPSGATDPAVLKTVSPTAATPASTPAPRSDAATGQSGRTTTLAVPPAALEPLPSFAPPPGAAPPFAELVARGSRIQPLLADLQTRLDQSQFDLDALNARLTYDAQTLADFVRTEIAFEQYPGVLRGPEGTLIGRAGSALDQALLLRRLLDDAGYETRLARTGLTATQAETLLNQMAFPRPAAPPPGDEAAMLSIVEQVAAVNGGRAADPAPNLAARADMVRSLTDDDAGLILQALAEAGITLGDPGLLNELIDEASDYFWIQYRLSSFDPWQDAHPAFTDAAAAPAGLTPTETFREGPPPDLYHRFRLEIFVEQKYDEELRVYPILQEWEKPVAELVGKPLTIQNQPNNLDLETAVAPEELLAETGMFLPIIDGELAQNAFDLDGRAYGVGLITLDTAGMTELFQSAAGGLETAAGLVGALGEEDPENLDDLFTLTAQWIEYTLIAPDGRETTTRRYVLDRLGEDNRAAGLAEISDETPLLTAAQALLTTYTVMLLPGEYSRAYIARRSVERALRELDLLAHIAPDGSLLDDPADLIASLVPLQDVLLNGAFANGNAAAAGLISYRPAPALVVYEQGLLPGREPGTAYERVDVIDNPRRVFEVANGAVRPAPAGAVRLGVWETVAERVLLQGTGAEPQGALQAIRAAAAAGIPLRVIPPQEIALIDTLPHSQETRASVRRDLAAGFVVILPERPLAGGEAATGWWRVDPTSGETLGMGTGGYGQAFVEYLISLKLGAMFAFIGYNQCRAAGGSAGCCLYENLALLAIGFTAGFWIGQIALAAGAMASTSFGVSVLLGDVGLGIAGLFNPVSICS